MCSGLCPFQLPRVQSGAVTGGLEQSLNLGTWCGEEAAPTNQVPGPRAVPAGTCDSTGLFITCFLTRKDPEPQGG